MKITKQEAIKRLSELEEEKKKLQEIIDKPEITPEQRFWQLCEGMTVKVDKEKYPNKTFFLKDGDLFFEYDSKKRYLWCTYNSFWKVFEKEHNMEYYEIQPLIKNLVEEHFKCNEVTPLPLLELTVLAVEEHFKQKDLENSTS